MNALQRTSSLLTALLVIGKLQAQLGWVDMTVLTDPQKAAITSLHADRNWKAEGTQLGQLKLKYYTGSNDQGSVWLKRWVVLPSVPIPALIGGELEDDERMAVQANPMVGLGFTLRRESIYWDGTKPLVNHKIAYQPMLLFYKYDVEKTRYGLVYGFAITFIDYVQIGYGRSDHNMPNYRGKDLLLLGFTVPIPGLFPEGTRTGSSDNMKAL